MRVFIFTESDRKYYKNAGSTKISLQIYEVKKNMPVWASSLTYNTGRTRGDFSEVMNNLIEQGILKGVETGYYEEETLNKKFTIRKV
jgi:hypothetical protein